MQRCPTCGQPRDPHALSRRVLDAEQVLARARRTTQAEELAAHGRRLAETLGEVRAGLAELEAQMGKLLAGAGAAARGLAPTAAPPEFNPSHWRRDPPPPEFRALVRGLSPVRGPSPTAAPSRQAPYQIPGRPAWPVPPPPEWHALRRALAGESAPR